MTIQISGRIRHLRQIPKEAMGLCGLEWLLAKNQPSINAHGRTPFRMVDLFCGCGGLSLGAWEAVRQRGLKPEITLAIDTQADAIQVYRRNFDLDKKTARLEDVSRIFSGNMGDSLTGKERYWKGRAGALDLLVAGPPCQGHSDLNNITRRSDPRNALYLRAIRAVEVFRPRFVIIENVPTVRHDKRGVLARSLSALRGMGYPDAGLSSAVIDAHDHGVPQTRRRHFLVAARECAFDICKGLAPIRSNGAILRDFIGDLVEVDQATGIFDTPSTMSELNKKRATHLYRNGLYDLEDARRPPCHRDKDHSYKSVYGRLQWGQPAQTITGGFGSMGQGRFLHPSAIRVITPHEAARLQGFPDFYDFSQAKKRTALHEMIGNAVIPRIAALIVWSLLEASDVDQGGML